MQCVIVLCFCLQTDAVNECIRCLDNAENDQQRSSIRAVFDKKNKGADAVIRRKVDNWVDVIRSVTGGDKVTVAADVVGAITLAPRRLTN